jgi:hypothetical protein
MLYRVLAQAIVGSSRITRVVSAPDSDAAYRLVAKQLFDHSYYVIDITSV